MSVLITQYIKFFDCIHFNFYLNKIKHDTYCVQKHTLLKRWGINRRANESPYFIVIPKPPPREVVIAPVRL